MTDAQSPPSHRSLPADLVYLRAALGDIPQTAARLLDDAISRAQTETDQARIWHREAADRERALAAVQRVDAELDRLAGLLPDARAAGPDCGAHPVPTDRACGVRGAPGRTGQRTGGAVAVTRSRRRRVPRAVTAFALPATLVAAGWAIAETAAVVMRAVGVR